MNRFDPWRRMSVAITAVLLSLSALLSPMPPAAHAASSVPRLPKVSAVLMDVDTGQVLLAKAADRRRPIASTTKIMTAIVVAERASLDAPVIVAPAATKVGESSAELVRRERRTVRELLYATMLKSANDAATALAIYVGHGVRGFASMMNRKAVEIGARRTHYVNPHGLTAPGHYSTARDLAMIAAYGLKNPIVARIVKTRKAKIPWPKHRYPRVFTNHNKLLWTYRGAIGVKTGYTGPAGSCLVAAAKRGPVTLVSVVLGAASADEAYSTSAALLNYGFANYGERELVSRGKRYARMSIPELDGEDLGVVASRTVTRRIFIPRGALVTPVVSRRPRLPISRGEFLGEAKVEVGGKVVERVPLVASRTIDAPTLWDKLLILWRREARQVRSDDTASK